MRFSIIIPAYNAQNTLRACLEAVFSSSTCDFEVIAVDDGSTDQSLAIAKNYSCRIIPSPQNQGPAHSRNTGVAVSAGEILVFIDSDVLIKNDTLSIIDKSFQDNKDLAALTGMLSKECPINNFSSQYKNLYMHYIFNKCPESIDFLYGSIIAIKKEHFLPFDETFRITDDTELGQRYNKLNKKIILNHELEVTHLKHYNLASLIRNDFWVPFWWAKSFLKYKGYTTFISKRGFSHSSLRQFLTICFSYLFILFLFFMPAKIISLSIFIFIFLLNRDYLLFLNAEKGTLFALGAVFFIMFDSLIMGAGVFIGLSFFAFKGKLDSINRAQAASGKLYSSYNK
ncbi:MAG: glycosyltransferase family 2 protein [Candidatus Omnitrophica bacterium]|nr:glycosyltransferase family 2 protein [Candidatus Omnitrophota bacterium]